MITGEAPSAKPTGRACPMSTRVVKFSPSCPPDLIDLRMAEMKYEDQLLCPLCSGPRPKTLNRHATDFHYCLGCHTLIEGLEIYNEHKKLYCPALGPVLPDHQYCSPKKVGSQSSTNHQTAIISAVDNFDDGIKMEPDPHGDECLSDVTDFSDEAEDTDPASEFGGEKDSDKNNLATYSHLFSASGAKQGKASRTERSTHPVDHEAYEHLKTMMYREILQTEDIPQSYIVARVTKCLRCESIFKNNYSLAKHILNVHIGNNRQLLLNNDFQKYALILKKFQCRICKFYCSESEDFILHIASDAHSQTSSLFDRSLVCVVCQYSSSNSQYMITHFMSREHRKAVSNIADPCVLKVNENISHIKEEPEMTANNLMDKQKQSDLAENESENAHDDDGKTYNEFQNVGSGNVASMDSNIDQETDKFVSNQIGTRTKTSTCHYCAKSFKTHHQVLVHVRSKHAKELKSGSFPCSYCGMVLKTFFTLKKHIKTKHKIDDVEFENDDVEIYHEDTNQTPANFSTSEKWFPCKYCGVSLRKRYTLEKHIRRKHHNEKTIACPVCSRRFFDKKGLYAHCENFQHFSEPVIHKDPAVEKSSELISCHHCDLKFQSPEKLKFHLINSQTRDEYKTRQLDGIPEKYHAFLKENMKQKKTKDLTNCPECGKSMIVGNLFSHIRGHGDESSRIYECKFCSKSFTSQSALTTHHKIHLDALNIRCKFCNKGFRRTELLEAHEYNHHRTETNHLPRFICEHCGKKFIHKHTYEIHVKIHLKQNMKCPYEGCTAVLSYGSGLRSHIRLSHSERTHLCDECGHTTRTLTQLKKHRRSHFENKYKCDHCPFSAAFKEGLTRHMLLHTGTKPFRCPHCDYRCYEISNLRNHVKKHIGLCVYHCKLCPMATNDSKEYRIHMITEHDVSPKDILVPSEYAGLRVEDKVSDDVQIRPVKTKMPRAKKPKASKMKTIIKFVLPEIIAPSVSKPVVINSPNLVSEQVDTNSPNLVSEPVVKDQPEKIRIHVITPPNLVSEQAVINSPNLVSKQAVISLPNLVSESVVTNPLSLVSESVVTNPPSLVSEPVTINPPNLVSESVVINPRTLLSQHVDKYQSDLVSQHVVINPHDLVSKPIIIIPREFVSPPLVVTQPEPVSLPIFIAPPDPMMAADSELSDPISVEYELDSVSMNPIYNLDPVFY